MHISNQKKLFNMQKIRLKHKCNHIKIEFNERQTKRSFGARFGELSFGERERKKNARLIADNQIIQIADF